MINLAKTLILVILATSSCNRKVEDLQMKEVARNYETGTDPNRYQRIELSMDSNFVYEWRNDYLTGRTIGRWWTEGESVVLDSYIKPGKMEEALVNPFPPDAEGFVVKMIDADYGFGVPNVRLIVFNEEETFRCVTNGDGNCVINDFIPTRVMVVDPTYASYMIEVPGGVEGIKVVLDPYSDFTGIL